MIALYFLRLRGGDEPGVFEMFKQNSEDKKNQESKEKNMNDCTVLFEAQGWG